MDPAGNGAAAALDDGLTVEQAAELLGVSVRQIQRLAAAGQIGKWTLPKKANERAAPVVYSRAHVEAVAAGGSPNSHAVAEVAAKEPQSKSAILPPVPAGLGLVIERLAHLLGPPRPEPKPWLGLKEAAEDSGIPLGTLRELAPAFASIGDALRVGKGRHARWIIRRAALERPLPI